MREFVHILGGTEVRISLVERAEDLGGLALWLARAPGTLGLDCETTGLDVYAPGHRLRTVQLGDDREGWVVPFEFCGMVREVLRGPRHFVVHNQSYDCQVLDRHLGVRAESLAGRVHDTKIYAHLLDPRARSEGGLGHSLKELSTVYVCESAKHADTELKAAFRKEGLDWASVPLDHPVYALYAGLDPILAYRLWRKLMPLVVEAQLVTLLHFEHRVQECLILSMRKGMRVDVEYATGLGGRLEAESVAARADAAGLGVSNVESTAQVARVLADMGEVLTETTETGLVKVDKSVLSALADVDLQGNRLGGREPNPLAAAALSAKRASKWKVAYVDGVLERLDSDDRVHPSINSLQARTARMSISSPPLQQLPSSDWMIRRMFVADPGEVVIAADYSQVEMRVLAALAKDRTMIDAICSGEDLHDFTARIIYGDGFTKAQRKLAKGVGFGKVYGGGAETLSRQTGADMASVTKAIAAYDRTFPGVKRLSRKLQTSAQFGKREVVTPSGRHLPLDRDRLYSAVNYAVQSTARDILAEAILRIFDAGLGQYLLVPVHDELVCSVPAEEATAILCSIREMMEIDFYGVPIKSDGAVYGPSWGHGYGARV